MGKGEARSKQKQPAVNNGGSGGKGKSRTHANVRGMASTFRPLGSSKGGGTAHSGLFGNDGGMFSISGNAGGTLGYSIDANNYTKSLPFQAAVALGLERKISGGNLMSWNGVTELSCDLFTQFQSNFLQTNFHVFLKTEATKNYCRVFTNPNRNRQDIVQRVCSERDLTLGDGKRKDITTRAIECMVDGGYSFFAEYISGNASVQNAESRRNLIGTLAIVSNTPKPQQLLTQYSRLTGSQLMGAPEVVTEIDSLLSTLGLDLSFNFLSKTTLGIRAQQRIEKFTKRFTHAVNLVIDQEMRNAGIMKKDFDVLTEDGSNSIVDLCSPASDESDDVVVLDEYFNTGAVKRNRAASSYVKKEQMIPIIDLVSSQDSEDSPVKKKSKTGGTRQGPLLHANPGAVENLKSLLPHMTTEKAVNLLQTYRGDVNSIANAHFEDVEYCDGENAQKIGAKSFQAGARAHKHALQNGASATTANSRQISAMCGSLRESYSRKGMQKKAAHIGGADFSTSEGISKLVKTMGGSDIPADYAAHSDAPQLWKSFGDDVDTNKGTDPLALGGAESLMLLGQSTQSKDSGLIDFSNEFGNKPPLPETYVMNKDDLQIIVGKKFKPTRAKFMKIVQSDNVTMNYADGDEMYHKALVRVANENSSDKRGKVEKAFDVFKQLYEMGMIEPSQSFSN
mmetsp:Transcript_17113/g.20998  ORF Transcript_17113/g.20998 Transcript_17113/m.20998 type:complete len:678 (+) Transcript_17113:57-2090(+)